MEVLFRLDAWIRATFQRFTEWFEIETGKNCYWLAWLCTHVIGLYTLFLALLAFWMRVYFPVLVLMIVAVLLIAVVGLSRWTRYLYRLSNSHRSEHFVDAHHRVAVLILATMFPIMRVSLMLMRSGAPDEEVSAFSDLILFVDCYMFYVALLMILLYLVSCIPLPPGTRLEKRIAGDPLSTHTT